jgi:hypothetical protein
MVGVHVSPVSVTAAAADAGVSMMHHGKIPTSATKTTTTIVTIFFRWHNFQLISHPPFF